MRWGNMYPRGSVVFPSKEKRGGWNFFEFGILDGPSMVQPTAQLIYYVPNVILKFPIGSK